MTEVPASKPEVSEPEAPKIFHPIIFFFGFLVVIGSGYLVYKKLTVSLVGFNQK